MEERLPRKLAAILYADVAEYSRLTGEDEDAMHRRLSDYLDLISNTIEYHHGKVMHYAGDAVLAVQQAVAILNVEVSFEKNSEIDPKTLRYLRDVIHRQLFFASSLSGYMSAIE